MTKAFESLRNIRQAQILHFVEMFERKQEAAGETLAGRRTPTEEPPAESKALRLSSAWENCHEMKEGKENVVDFTYLVVVYMCEVMDVLRVEWRENEIVFKPLRWLMLVLVCCLLLQREVDTLHKPVVVHRRLISSTYVLHIGLPGHIQWCFSLCPSHLLIWSHVDADYCCTNYLGFWGVEIGLLGCWWSDHGQLIPIVNCF